MKTLKEQLINVNESNIDRYDIYVHSKQKMIAIYDKNKNFDNHFFKTIDDAVIAVYEFDSNADIRIIVSKFMQDYLDK